MFTTIKNKGFLFKLGQPLVWRLLIQAPSDYVQIHTNTHTQCHTQVDKGVSLFSTALEVVSRHPIAFALLCFDFQATKIPPPLPQGYLLIPIQSGFDPSSIWINRCCYRTGSWFSFANLSAQYWDSTSDKMAEHGWLGCERMVINHLCPGKVHRITISSASSVMARWQCLLYLEHVGVLPGDLTRAEVMDHHPFTTNRCLLESWWIQRITDTLCHERASMPTVCIALLDW